MNAAKAIAGAVTAFAGVWTLAGLPVVNPGPALLIGWTLLVLGACIFAPAFVDLFFMGDDE